MNPLARPFYIAAFIVFLLVGYFKAPEWLAGIQRYGREWVAIDRCLDSGGRWNYETKQCEYGEPAQARLRASDAFVD